MTSCIQVTDNGRELCIRFPGGSRICASPPGIIAPPPDELAQILMGQASTALAPLEPIFNMINTLVAVKDFAEAVPALLFDPSQLVEATESLIENVNALASLAPPLSVPALLIDLLNTILQYLAGIVERLQSLVEQQVRIEEARTQAITNGLTDLLVHVECSEEQVLTILDNIQSSSGPIGSLIVAINSLGSLIGLPEIAFGDLTGNVSETLDQISDLVTTITVARDAIPI